MAILACVAMGCDGSGAKGSDPGPADSVDPGVDVPAVDPGVPDVPPEIEACVPDCADRDCGSDGCGGSCGQCETSVTCLANGRCDGAIRCFVSCAGHCGTSCSVDCGSCPEGQYCSATVCNPCPDACQGHCAPDSPECLCPGRSCGSDGFGGTCLPGCAGDLVCDLVAGACMDTCDWPAFKAALTWGPVGRVSVLQTPAEVPAIQGTCQDFTGDGLGDNGLKGLASQINGPMATLVAGVTTVILVELAGVMDFTAATAFPVNGLVTVGPADPSTSSADFRVPESTYVTDICRPRISLAGATITNGVLEAGPTAMPLSIPVEGLTIDLLVQHTRLKGIVVNGDIATGFDLQDGALTGVLTKQELNAAVNRLMAACDALPVDAQPDYCRYKTTVSALPLLYDLHQNGDGTFAAKTKDLPGDAASICLTFTLAKARVVGFEAAAVP